MSPASTSQGASYTDERRRNPRLRVSSIIYAQLGSDNGGVVANLGMDGVACHAAQKLNAEMNSAVNLRLRGSGLNSELTGEFVWMDATQKEVGISFKSLSANAQKDIANWIAREAGQAAAPEAERITGPKAMSAMPGIAAKEEKSFSHSFSAALAMAKESAPKPIPSIDAGTNGLIPQPSLDSTAAASNAAAPAVYSLAPPAIPPLSVPVEPSVLEPSPLYQNISGPFLPWGAEQFVQIVQTDAPPPILPDAPKTQAVPEMAEASSNLLRDAKIANVEKIEKDAAQEVSRPPAKSIESNVAEEWIPPALLAAWRRGNRRQRLIIAGTGAISLGTFGLIITLAAIHLGGSLRHSSGTLSVQQSVQQSVAPPADSPVGAATPQLDPVQTISAPVETPTPRSHRPQPSPLATLAKKLFWSEPDPAPTIDDDQLRVQVWTSRNSGYYYCTDDPYAKSAQPGAFMSQGDALQSGYRPILGQFCE